MIKTWSTCNESIEPTEIRCPYPGASANVDGMLGIMNWRESETIVRQVEHVMLQISRAIRGCRHCGLCIAYRVDLLRAEVNQYEDSRTTVMLTSSLGKT